jgi:hypothetical protein
MALVACKKSAGRASHKSDSEKWIAGSWRSRTVADAKAVSTGWFRGSFAAIAMAVCLAWHPSLHAKTIATTISIKTPRISHFQPRAPMILWRLNSPTSLNGFSSGGPSIFKPIYTIIPPIAAKTEITNWPTHHDTEGNVTNDNDVKFKMLISLVWGIPLLIVALVFFFIMHDVRRKEKRPYR